MISDRQQTYILVYGFLGFAEIGIPGLHISYFRKVADSLEGMGLRCLVANNLPARGSVAARAEALRQYLVRHDAKRVVLIAHSMGGLDGRYLIERLDVERRVRCLVTLGTPHRGTPLAEWALAGRGPLARLLRAIGRDGLEELTPEACARRNEELRNRPDVRYLSVAGARPADEQAVWFRLLVPNVMDDEGPHDGLVSVASAEWGEFIGTVAADHLELVGWDLSATRLLGLGWLRRRHRETFDHRQLYEMLANRTMSLDGD